MAPGKSFFASLKGQKVKFERVTSFPDVKIQFVDSFPDIKLQKVSGFPDFEVFLK